MLYLLWLSLCNIHFFDDLKHFSFYQLGGGHILLGMDVIFTCLASYEQADVGFWPEGPPDPPQTLSAVTAGAPSLTGPILSLHLCFLLSPARISNERINMHDSRHSHTHTQCNVLYCMCVCVCVSKRFQKSFYNGIQLLR